jgi:tetratricopeptide (TPR) repeat protein
LAFYQDFLKQGNEEPLLRKDVAEAHFRYGDTLRLLGENQEALAQYDAGSAGYLQLLEASPSDALLRAKLAGCFTGKGESLRAEGRVEDARNAHEKARELFSGLAADFHDKPDYRKEWARSMYNLGIVRQELKDFTGAEKVLSEAIAILKKLVAEFPNNGPYQQDLARSWLNLGPVQRATGNPTEARKANETAIALLTDLSKTHPDQPEYRHDLGVALNNFSILLKLQKASAEAEQVNLHSQELLKRLADDFPGVPEYRKNLAIACNSRGLLFAEKRDWPQAERWCKEACDLLEPLAAGFPDNVDFHGRLGMALGNLGWILLSQEKNLPQAKKLLENGIAELHTALKLNPRQAAYRRAVGEQNNFLIRVLQLLN